MVFGLWAVELLRLSRDTHRLGVDMKTSEQTNEITAALAKAQGELKNPEKLRTAKYPTKAGGVVEYNYADLPACLDAGRDPLSKNGLAFTSSASFVENNYTLFCRLTHTSGQWYESEWPLPGAAEPKIIGASMTYGIRYLFCGLTGMSGEEDMDEAPEPKGQYAARSPVAPKASSAPHPTHPSEAQIKRLYTLASTGRIPTEVVKAYCEKHFKITTTKDLTMLQYNELCNQIESGRIIQEPGSTG
jgi:hypothetical protein